MNKEIYNDYLKLSSEITKKLDNTALYESWLIIQEYIDRCQERNQKYKEVIDKLTFIKNRARAGATQETINKLAITFVNAYLKEVE